MYSINRRFERYRLLYCYKIIIGQTQNCGLTWNFSDNLGLKIEVPKFKKYFKSQREQSFNYQGPKMFNNLPLYLRGNTHNTMLEWKQLLDEFISLIPDYPLTSRMEPGLCDLYSSKPTNSLDRWIPYLGLTGRRDRKEPVNLPNL